MTDNHRASCSAQLYLIELNETFFVVEDLTVSFELLQIAYIRYNGEIDPRFALGDFFTIEEVVAGD